MLEFGFSNMRFEQNESRNIDDGCNFVIFNDDDNLQWGEMIAPDHFPSFDLDYEKLNQQNCKSGRNGEDLSLQKKDECNQTKLAYIEIKVDIFKQNESNTLNKECVKIGKTKEQSTSLCALSDNIANPQFEKPENLICKGSKSNANKVINTDKDEDSLEYLKKLVDGKNFKESDKK